MEIIVLPIFLLLVLITVPIGMALLVAAIFGLSYFADMPLLMIGQAMFLKLDKFSLLSILFFVLAGNLMSSGSIARKIVEFAEALVGHFRSGLPISSIAACGIFGAVSGSALATLSAIGGLMVPAMQKKGISKDLSVGVVTSASILGIIVPPSIPMIIYCLVTDTSIAKLFIAGFLPALLIGGALSIYSVFRSGREGAIEVSPFSFTELWTAFASGIWALLMPAIIFGGIFSGVFTATEAAVVATVYAYLVEIFVYRKMSLGQIVRITIDSGVMLGAILIITAGSMVLSDYLSLMQIPDRITQWIVATMNSKWFFLLMVNAMLLVVGCFMEVISAILIVTPILFPVATEFGIDPIHFGILICVNLGIGYVTPPVGVNCFLAASLFKMPVSTVFRVTAPTLVALLISLGLITAVPWLSTILPDLLVK